MKSATPLFFCLRCQRRINFITAPFITIEATYTMTQPFRRGALYGGAIGLGLLFYAASVGAAERVVFQYRGLERAIAVADITTLAETGRSPRSLRPFLRLANQEPEEVQQTLTRTIPMSPVLLDRVLNSPIGSLLLDEVTPIIHTPGNTADRQALRSALVLSAADDNTISLLEILQNYPTQDVEVDVVRLGEAVVKIGTWTARIQQALDFLQF